MAGVQRWGAHASTFFLFVRVVCAAIQIAKPTRMPMPPSQAAMPSGTGRARRARSRRSWASRAASRGTRSRRASRRGRGCRCAKFGPGVGGLGAIRRRIEGDIPDEPLEVEEYSHFGMVGRYTAGAMNLPFFPLPLLRDRPAKGQPAHPTDRSPYGDGTIYAVPPLRPDVAIVHAQRPRPAATPRSGACSAARRRRLSRPTASSSSSRSWSTRRSSGPTRTGRSSPGSSSMRSSSSRGAPTRRTSRAPTTGTTGSISTGTRSPATRRRPRRGCASGSTASTGGPPTSTSSARSGSRAPPRPGAVRLGRLRGVPVMRRRAFTKSEMMIVAAARELAGQHVCFVGVGLPNIAVNLAKRTVAPDLELVYEAGVFGARPARLPL